MTTWSRSRRAYQNRHVGENRNFREARGKHSQSKKWRPGDNWVECQRCGHDCLASEAREDQYTKGLIVCPACMDFEHPQEYVRAYEDRISPPSGMVTGEGEFSRVGAVGSTEVPEGTFDQSDTINNPVLIPLAPNDVANTCWGWWDFSESAGTFCYTTSTEQNTPVSDESDIRQVVSRCNSTVHNTLVPDQTNEAAFTGTWDGNVKNGNGAFFADSKNGSSTGSTLESDTVISPGGLPQPFTIVGVLQTPTNLNLEGNFWFGPTLSNGHNFGLSPDETGNVGTWEVTRTNPTPYFSIDTDGLDLAARAGDWYIWYQEIPVDPAVATRTYSGEDAPTPLAVDTTATASGGMRLGMKNLNTTTFPYYGWNAYIGEVLAYEGLLSDTDKEGLKLYLTEKWGLTDSIL